MKKIVLISFTLFLYGCLSTPVMKTSTGNYSISMEDNSEIYASVKELKAKVMDEADKFAKEKGKIAVPVSFDEKPKGNNLHNDWARVDYTFSLVDAAASHALPLKSNTAAAVQGVKQQAAQIKHQVLQLKQQAAELEQQTAELKLQAQAMRQQQKQQAKRQQADQAKQQKSGPIDYYNELKKLKQLLDEDVITEQEFVKLKSKIINQ